MRNHLLTGLLLAAVALAPACAGRDRGQDVATIPPPPAPVVEQEPRLGHVWVEGRWAWNDGRWAWTDGHWMPARRDHVWRQGRWVKVPNGYAWRPGKWQDRSTVEAKHRSAH